MKQWITIAALALLLAACGQTEQPAADNQPPSAPATAPSAPAPVTPAAPPSPAPVTPAETPKLSDLKSVFGMTGSYKCTAKMEGGQGAFYIKNGKVRTDATSQGIEAHSVFDGDDIWTWSAQGCYHIRLSDIEALTKNLPEAKPATREEMAEQAADVDCQAASVPDSMFTAPSPCQDMAEMMKQLQSAGYPQG